jgi:hypothetical protein
MRARDIYNFWTSSQVHEHLHNLAERIRGRYSIEIHIDVLMLWIGSYAAQLQPPPFTGLIAADQSAIQIDVNVPNNQRKRGRPAELPLETKQLAMEAKLEGKGPLK